MRLPHVHPAALTTNKLTPALILLALAFAGWLYYDNQQERQRSVERRTADLARAASLPKDPVVTSWPTAEGTFIQVDHRIPLSPGSRYAQTQRCYVWRDKATNTSTMSCVGDGLNFGD